MNYTEYCESLTKPLYQKEGSIPRCPPGYVFDKKKMDCVPKTDKDNVKGRLQDDKRHDGEAQYNVWGRTGLNGDGYAWEEPPQRDANALPAR